MATFDTTRPTQSGPRFGAGVLNTLFASVLTWYDRRATRDALHRLSDRELEDIGLNRGDIDTHI